MPKADAEPVVVDVRPIPRPQRHTLIFDALDKLAIGESLVALDDRSPIPLRGQIEAAYGEQFAWRYLEEGPEVFCLEITRRAAAPGGGEKPEDSESGSPAALSPVGVDLLQTCRAASASGPQWSHEGEDLDMTLLSWARGRGVEPHVNDEVDVVWIGVEGAGIVRINDQDHELRPGMALLIPKGCRRAVESASERFSYLSVHRRRRGLRPTLGRGGRPL